MCSYLCTVCIYLYINGLSPVGKYTKSFSTHIQRKKATVWPLHVLHHAAKHVNFAQHNGFQLISQFKQDSEMLFLKSFCCNYIVSEINLRTWVIWSGLNLGENELGTLFKLLHSGMPISNWLSVRLQWVKHYSKCCHTQYIKQCLCLRGKTSRPVVPLVGW